MQHSQEVKVHYYILYNKQEVVILKEEETKKKHSSSEHALQLHGKNLRLESATNRINGRVAVRLNTFSPGFS